MSRIVRIVTSSFATLENTKPPFNIHPPSPEENLNLAKEILDAAGSYHPDLALLPETFLWAGRSFENIRETAEIIPDQTFNMLSAMARKYKMHIVAGHVVKEQGKIFNKGLVINRTGELVGSYNKNHPVAKEIDSGITPGDEVPVFDLDFGRIGVSVCFDLNWEDVWAEFAVKKIDLACWISAYEGGFPLQSYAWKYQYPIVSSVWPYHARIYDITGEKLVSTSRWNRILFHELNLDRALLHTDNQMQKIIAIQKKYGENVLIKAFTEEHLFLLENQIPNKTIKDLLKEFDLVTYKDYIEQCTILQNKQK
jgi:predicted amidohydrolase